MARPCGTSRIFAPTKTSTACWRFFATTTVLISSLRTAQDRLWQRLHGMSLDKHGGGGGSLHD